MKEYKIYRLFSSPIFNFRPENYNELNTELEEYILDLKKKYKNGQIKSNRGGWHSPFFDLIKDDSTILEGEPLEKAAEMGELMVYRHDGFWQCMDTKRDRDSLEEMWEDGSVPWRQW